MQILEGFETNEKRLNMKRRERQPERKWKKSKMSKSFLVTKQRHVLQLSKKEIEYKRENDEKQNIFSQFYIQHYNSIKMI